MGLLFFSSVAVGEPDYSRALKRSQYLLNSSVPTDAEIDAGSTEAGYRAAVRAFINDENFYDVMLRYHERLFGTGLPTEYLDELQRDDIDGKSEKFAQISCNNDGSRFRCAWSGGDNNDNVSSCPVSWEQAVSVFWYPGIVAWVCPSVVRACGSDLSRCFIEYENQQEAVNAELGTTEIFDSRFSVVKSLSKQSAGIATAVVVANYPYTKILEPGLTAVDGAIAHFYRQQHHFDLDKVSPPQELLDIVSTLSLTDTRYRLVYTGNSYEQGGVLTTFGWLRRYEKNRTRANQLYERLLCRQFTSELPAVFPADPGNLRTTPGCSGCHATLDPLSDFFNSWGEGGELYTGQKSSISTTFGGQTGSYISDLANIIRNDNAFGTCQVQNAWEYLMGRGFYREEADLRAALTQYFITTGYSFKELLYAIATHNAFVEGTREDALVGDPLTEPPLGEPPGGGEALPCDDNIDFATDIQPNVGQCTTCHNSSSAARQPLETEEDWSGSLGHTSVTMMTSGSMPPGQAGPPFSGAVFDLKEAVRCWLEQNQ
jgi:hypothetical protein